MDITGCAWRDFWKNISSKVSLLCIQKMEVNILPFKKINKFKKKIQKQQCAPFSFCLLSAHSSNRYMQVLEKHIRPVQLRFSGTSCLFQQDNAKSHSATITKAWLHSKRVQLLNWPACPYMAHKILTVLLNKE